MSTLVASHPPSRRLPRILAWKRLRFALGIALFFALLLGTGWKSGFGSIFPRTLTVALVGVVVFGLVERFPRRLPRFLARWVLQVVAVALAMPWTTFWIWMLSTPDGAPMFWTEPDRMEGFATLTGLSTFLAPWIALGALVRQKEALARTQALEFELERSELGRQALDARLRLLQAQVAPHFLFNTLANVQALVDAGSPQASVVLRSLVAYLRAAVPRLDRPAASFAEEIDLVRAYLEIMHMRMPDRLTFALHVDDAARGLLCPPMTLLTLVENAVRHGIDPSEEGGRIDVQVLRRGDRCVVRVSDTGAGPAAAGSGLGTGLSTLRERLELAFDGDARLIIGAQHPRGASAEVEFPARPATATP